MTHCNMTGFILASYLLLPGQLVIKCFQQYTLDFI